MVPRLRKAALTAHVMCSVGWLGSVAVFLALAITGLTSRDGELAGAVYIAMEVTTWSVIVPLSFATLLTGVVQSLGTPWGLLRHYWVVVKLALTVAATVLLLVHTQPISYAADLAAGTGVTGAELHGLKVQLVADAAAALLVLLTTTALSVFKPQGRTRYGWRKQREQDRSPAATSAA
ncbi:hypothetical protein [Streptomyces cavernicola]|uniref:DUF2269 domain-containing protein n=1 Tax=Streptomyces cavernicola TaxID=3043613 RepID=A0ABT6S7T8_9ACTN|nr:hypothetical protein [Streptomyces sp. B-S-A6]MDI3404159.1 hypothetical protein [Streptomyces sp. B-S-A6]